jgi:hypothetical protein
MSGAHSIPDSLRFRPVDADHIVRDREEVNMNVTMLIASIGSLDGTGKRLVTIPAVSLHLADGAALPAGAVKADGSREWPLMGGWFRS